jgi:hypothetical protein
MRLSKSLFTLILSSATLLALATSTHAQVTAQNQTNANGTYTASDPLANVRYDNRYDISLGAAYVRFVPGPNAVHGDNIGGLDLSGSYWLTHNLGIEGSARYYLGTAGAAPNNYHINGPFVSQAIFAAGPEWLGPHNKHGAFIAHAMFGGAYGNFQQDLRNAPQSAIGFYSNGMAPAGVIGGHIDLNRSPQWVFRITPDALWTRYSTNYTSSTSVPTGSYNNWNFGISVGVEYKFKKKR